MYKRLVQIEYVTGIGLTSWRTVKQQRKCTVSYRVLGQIVVNDQNVETLLASMMEETRRMIATSSKAVSYTHLDVYKRQARVSVMSLLRQSVRPAGSFSSRIQLWPA